MNLKIKRFKELTTDELYAILKLRVSVFVVEQKCPYMELDGLDRGAIHVWLEEEDGIQAYLRILDRGVENENVAIGRVIAVKNTAASEAGSWKRGSKRRGRFSVPKRFISKPRLIPRVSMKSRVLNRFRLSFCSTGSLMSG